jgi:hypothetical protein
MGRPAYGGPTCESCPSIDVRSWHREGRLHIPHYFSCSWTYGGGPCGRIGVHVEEGAVVLAFRSRTSEDGERRNVEQRVPISWTACHLGGRRAWFRCSASSNGQYCGRRAAKLYLGGSPVFACRHCCGLAYASQQESLHHRGLGKAQKIRMRLGGTGNMFDDFPAKPKGMHRRTYIRLRHSHDVAAARSTIGLMQFVDHLSRRSSRRRAQ